VAQRIPLKISIDRVEGKEKLKANLRLLSGMSANVKIVKE
jgi:membrane fusion protein (multidrug efflux system)